MIEQKSQAHLLLEMVPRLFRLWKVIVVLWVVVTLTAGFITWKLYIPTYTSECVLLVRPLNVVDNPIGKVDTDDEVIFASNPLSAIMPDALTVDLYEAMLKSDPILAEVQRLFLEQHGAAYPPEKHPRRYQMREWMKAEARVSLKSTMAVEYNPSVFLKVQAPDPDIAHQLMVIWVGVAEEKFRDLLFSSGVQRAYELADAEYRAKMDELERLDLERVGIKERQIAEHLALDDEWATRIEALETASDPEPGLRHQIDRLKRQAEAAKATLRVRHQAELAQVERATRNLQRLVEDMGASRTQASLVVARQADEFTVLSEPTLPEVLSPPPLFIFLLASLVPALMGVITVMALWLVVSEINRRYAPRT